ncbi:hypothetical protein DFJ74DRAFT_696510 [Hyaloraphidium curvatum]|nr:hypothetical protein DFJ74DRAFT_696510 [Hyaloraphidium curvatum]
MSGVPRVTQAVAISAYCLSSLLMLLTNKHVLSGYKFTASFLLLAVQCGATVGLLEAFRAGGLLSRREFRWAEAKAWSPVSLLLVAMIYTSTMALAHFSIPLFTVMKHFTIIAIAFSERFFLNGAPVTPLVMVSFVLMIVSAIVAGWGDLRIKTGAEDRWKAYAWMFANCVASAAYSVGMRGAMLHTHFKDFDVVFYNNLLALPLLLILSFVFEPTAWTEQRFSALPPSSFSPQTLGWLVLVTGIVSFAISYTTSWSVRSVGSTSTSVAGALNKLPVAVTGMLVFGDPVTVTSVGGVLLAFFGGLLYTHAKTREKAAPPALDVEKAEKEAKKPLMEEEAEKQSANP